MKAQNRINAAANLDELCRTLNTISDELRETQIKIDDLVDLPSLPVFGGSEPACTSEVWSWDETRVLVDDGSCWRIDARCACGEAIFHCKCV